MTGEIRRGFQRTHAENHPTGGLRPDYINQTSISAGVRGTNAELWGMGGNAPGWGARAFGSIGFVVKLPKKASVVFATEVAQQPRHPDQLPTAIIPTTLTYAARFSLAPESKLSRFCWAVAPFFRMCRRGPVASCLYGQANCRHANDGME